MLIARGGHHGARHRHTPPRRQADDRAQPWRGQRDRIDRPGAVGSVDSLRRALLRLCLRPGTGLGVERGQGLPGVVTVIGGLLLVTSRNRAAAVLGAWLTIVAGAWFVVGRVVATTLTIGQIGAPVAPTDAKAAWLELAYFYGLGALIIFFGATALGRVSVRSVRDLAAIER